MQHAAANGTEILINKEENDNINTSLPTSSLICEAAVIDILFIPIKYPFIIDPIDINGINKARACKAKLQSGFFRILDVNIEDIDKSA